jgi:uncharacterized protein YaaN involved in tellurite resistance
MADINLSLDVTPDGGTPPPTVPPQPVVAEFVDPTPMTQQAMPTMQQAMPPMAEFVQQAAPMAQQAVPMMEQAVPVMQQAVPMMQQAVPVMQQAMPAMQQPMQMAQQAMPIMQQAMPVMQQAMPAMQQSMDMVQQVAPAMQQSMQAAMPAMQNAVQSIAPLDMSAMAVPAVQPQAGFVPSALPETMAPSNPLTAVADSAMLIPDSSMLTEAELKIVADFASKIDITNSAQILQYGAQAQKKTSSFTEQVLNNVKGKDVDEIGGMVTNMVMQLRGFDIEDTGKKRLFGKTRDGLAKKKTEFDSISANIDKICTSLENHKVQLLKDIHMLDQMYQKNLEYYKELTMYIIAGRQKLQHVMTHDLPVLQQKARQSGLQEDAQAANQFADMCNNFDKKLHDLELTRVVSIQTSPQIRLVQSANNVMVEKIHSSIVNTIPLWKNQMVLALGMANTQKALKAQAAVTDMTNDLLKKNADMLKQNSIAVARESERSIIDIETLRHTNQSLISTLDEVLQIQQTGREKRREAQVELHKIEEELKAKLLDIRDTGLNSTPVTGGNAGALPDGVPQELTM